MVNYRKIVIEGNLAHFKVPYKSKIQKTYPIPPISTVIGILENIFGEGIDNFKFGFTFQSNTRPFTDIQKVYKQTTLGNSKQVVQGNIAFDICHIEYLINPKLCIYTDINRNVVLEETLNLGKTDCLANIKISQANLTAKKGKGYNQWTPIDVGSGKVLRIATKTTYNTRKGIYDIETKVVRLNKTFNSDKNYDEEEGNIFMWKYEGGNVYAEIS